MNFTQMRYQSDAREKLLRGVEALSNAVRVTLGPRSKSVLMQKAWGDPQVCDDGVTIAKQIRLKDPEENLGAQMLRQAAEKTGDEVGDGTSTATILADAIFVDGTRNVVAGASAIDIKRGLEHGLGLIVAELKRIAVPVRSREAMAQVATIAAHNNPVIGELVADAMDRVGSDGVITVEESKTTETTLDVVEGLQFDRGYLSPYFVTDPDKMEAVLEDAFVLLCDRKIHTPQELIPVLEKLVKLGKPVLVVAEDIDGEALATLVLNRLRGVLQAVAVKAPGFGDRRKAMLADTASVTGAELISEDLGLKLETVEPQQLGHARRIVVDKDTTTIVGGGGDKTEIDARIRQIRAELDKASSDYDRDKLKERLGKLSSGVAVIHVGAPTEVEMKSRKEALDDAISATRAAVAEGTVPGGGLALLRCARILSEAETSLEGDQRTGLKILGRALSEPVRQIARNSAVDGGVVVQRMLDGDGALGFDAARNEYVDLVAAGIIDPAKVVRVALENAISVASTLLLTEATMTEIHEPDDESAAPQPAAF